MNLKAIQTLAKYRVKFEAKIGNTISLEDAIKFETKKLSKLQKENDYSY